MSEPSVPDNPHPSLVFAADEVPAPSDSRWVALAATMARAVRRQCPPWLADQAQDIAQAALAKVVALDKAAEGKRPLTTFYLHKVGAQCAHRRDSAPEAAPGSVVRGDGRRRRRGSTVRAENARRCRATPRTASWGQRCRECLAAVKRDRRLAVVLYLRAFGAGGRSYPRVGREAHREPGVPRPGQSPGVSVEQGPSAVSEEEPENVTRLRAAFAAIEGDGRERASRTSASSTRCTERWIPRTVEPGRRARVEPRRRGDLEAGA